MPGRPQANWGVAIVFGLIFAAIISAIILIPPVVSALRSAPSVTLASANITPTASAALEKARALLARLRDQVIPIEGTRTDYGVAFTDDGYQTLIQWNVDLKVDPHHGDGFEMLDLMLPCCDWSRPSRDEKTNCACGHHQALEGLAKKLLFEERSTAAVQSEVTRWGHYLYPKEALAAEMEKRAQLDPEIKAALEELKAHGEC